MSRKPKVLVAMSGGVDSSVAAALLLREGYDVVGCFMRLGSPGESFDELMEAAPDEPPSANGRCNGATGEEGGGPPRTKIKIGHQGCCSINDAADARLVAAKLGIPFYVVNFKKDFGRIIDYFVSEYNAGRTPNPCVRCNDWLKFGRLHEYAKQIDAQFVASGHYARIDRPSMPTDSNAWASPRLLRGIDHTKDQSYVLFGAPQERLAEMLLPIGGLHKTEVRRLARELDLPVFDKPDSQDICFVPDNDYAGLVALRTPERVRPGAVLDRRGRTIGQHPGHQHFTIGQRKGVGVAIGHPVYVVEKDPIANTITVGEREDLRVDRLIAHETNWLIETPQRAGPSSCREPSHSGRGQGEGDRAEDARFHSNGRRAMPSPPAPLPKGEGSAWLPCTAKYRYNTPAAPAEVRRTGVDELEVRFTEPQYGIAAGQAVVCYDDDAVICGGWISQAV